MGLWMLVWAEGCFPYRAPTGAPFAPRKDSRVRSDTPFSIFAQPPEGSPIGAECRATSIEGKVRSARGDTIRFDTLTSLVSVLRRDKACRGVRSEAIVIFPAGVSRAVTERQFSRKRTTLLVAGLLAVVGVLATIIYIEMSNLTFPPDLSSVY